MTLLGFDNQSPKRNKPIGWRFVARFKKSNKNYLEIKSVAQEIVDGLTFNRSRSISHVYDYGGYWCFDLGMKRNSYCINKGPKMVLIVVLVII
jgi:hypothetical protein